jgi:F-type H+-transporting ATPase subunit gamma
LVTNLAREIVDLREAKFIVVGRKGGELVRKLGGDVIAEFELGVAQPQFEFVIPLARVIGEELLKGSFSRLLTVYTRFESTLLQQPCRRTLLPISVLADPEAGGGAYLFEPSPSEVLDSLLSHYLEISLYQVVLEAVASEHSARMVAMRNAHENAAEMVDELKLRFNRARQEQITEEITDVVTARMALA